MFLAVKQLQCIPLSLHLFSWRKKCTPVSAFGRCNIKSQHVQFIQSFIKSTKWHRTKAEQHPSLCGTWTWLIAKLVFLASIHLSVRPLKFVIMYNNLFFFKFQLDSVVQGNHCNFFTNPLCRNSKKEIDLKKNQTKYRKMSRKPRSQVRIMFK